MTQTHWLAFGPADFDATQAPRAARPEQAALFDVATPVKAPRATDPGQLPGQVSIFDEEDAAGPHDQREVCSKCGHPVMRSWGGYGHAPGYRGKRHVVTVTNATDTEE